LDYMGGDQRWRNKWELGNWGQFTLNWGQFTFARNFARSPCQLRRGR
jgi:hypothetical protein